ncbi:MAG: DUF6531 domain-containing protein [Firmicutes bacterium]|nr:DUF6531 domain-containing protein [Bacillota bacterium]
MKNCFKFIRLVFILILLALTVSLSISADDAGGPDPQPQYPEGQEILKARSEYIKVFRDSHQVDTIYISSNPLHYRDSHGQWQEISTDLEEVDSDIATDEDGQRFGYRSLANTCQAFLPRHTQGWTQLRSGGHRLSFKLAASGQKFYNKRKDGIFVSGLLPKCDLSLTVRPGGIKEEITLRDRSAPREFEYLIRPNGLTAEKTPEGAILFKDSQGNTVFYMPPFFMFDANSAYSEDIQVSLTETNNGYRLKVVPDGAWLDNSGRQYPVTIDPTLIQITLNSYDPAGVDIDINNLEIHYYLPTTDFIEANSNTDDVPDLTYTKGGGSAEPVSLNGNCLFNKPYMLPYPIKVYYTATNYAASSSYWSAINGKFKISQINPNNGSVIGAIDSFVFSLGPSPSVRSGEFTLLKGQAARFEISNNKYFRFLGIDPWTSKCVLLIRAQKESMAPNPVTLNPLPPETPGTSITLRWKGTTDDWNRAAWEQPNYGPLWPQLYPELSRQRKVVNYLVQCDTNPNFTNPKNLSCVFDTATGDYKSIITPNSDGETYFFRVAGIDEEGNPWDWNYPWDPLAHPSAPRWSNIVSTRLVSPPPPGVPPQPAITDIIPKHQPEGAGEPDRYYSNSSAPTVCWDQTRAAVICFKNEKTFTESLTTVNTAQSSATVNPVPDGNYTVTAQTVNSIGKSLWSTPWKVTVDTKPPSLSSITEKVTGGNVSLSFSSNEEVNIDIYWDFAFLKNTGTYKKYVAGDSIDLGPLCPDVNAPHYYRLEVRDMAGNTYSTSTIQLGCGPGTNIANTDKNFGLEKYYNFQTISLGRAGTAKVNINNGNLAIMATDFSVPGRGLPLSMSRFYNSLADYQGILGKGWRSSYEMYLLISGQDLIISDPDGSSHLYKYNGSGYTRPAGDYRRIEAVTGGYIAYETNGIRYSFGPPQNGKCRLNSITDRFGNTLQLQYDGDGYLKSVKEPSGRITAVLEYNSQNRLKKITFTASGQAQARYVSFLYQGNSLWQVRFPTDKNVNGKDIETAVVYSYDSVNQLLSSAMVCEMAGYEEQSGTRKNDTTFGYKPLKRSIGAVAAYFRQDNQTIPVNYLFNYEGNTTTVIDPRGTKAVYVHTGGGQCQKVSYQKANGAELMAPVSYTYDADFNLKSVTQAKEVFNPLTDTVETRDVVTAYNYFADTGNLESVIVDDGAGYGCKRLATRFTYAPEQNHVLTDIAAIQDAKGNTTTYTNIYDGNGKLAKLVITPPETGDDYTIIHTFNQYGERTDKEVKLGSETTARYHFSYGYQDGLLSSLANFAGTTNYYYTVFGERNKIKDANNIQSQFLIYPATGQLKAVYAPEKAADGPAFADYQLSGNQSRYVYNYDVNGNKTDETDFTGMVNHYYYNELNLLYMSANAAGQSRSHYDASGNLINMYDPSGNYLEYVYDKLNRRTQVKACHGGVTGVIQEELEYDSTGRVKVRYDAYTVTGGRGGKTVYYYDSTDNLMKEEWVGKDGSRLITKYYKVDGATVISYDRNGNLLTKSAPLSGQDITGFIVTDYQYDALNRVTNIKVTGKSANGAIEIPKYNQSVSYTYEAGQIKTMEVTVSGQGKKTYTYYYDPAMRLDYMTNEAGQKFKFDYYPGGQRRHKYIYNQSTDPAPFMTVEYKYDEAYLLKKLDYRWTGGYYLTLDYDYQIYNGEDKIISNKVSYNLNAPEVASELLKQVRTYYDGVTYPTQSSVEQFYRNNYHTNAYTYDGLGRMTSAMVYGINPQLVTGNSHYSEKPPKVQTRSQTTWITDIDPSGNFKSKRSESYFDTTTNVTTETNQYNYLNQLTARNIFRQSGSSSEQIDYTYDEFGNLLAETPNSTGIPLSSPGQAPVTYSYGLDQQLIRHYSKSANYTQKKYEYGEYVDVPDCYNLTDKSFVYQLGGNLVKVTSIIHDDSNIYNRIDDNFNDYFYYSHDGVIAERHDDIGQVNYFTRLGREMLAADNNGDPYFYIQNIRGDIVMLVRPDGSVISIRDYDASGQMLGRAPRDDRDPFGFTGGLDAGKGLWKLGARFYDSSKGSFIQQDRYMGSIDDPLSLNRYVYCQLDPVNYVDPTGFTEESVLEDTADKLSNLSYGMNVLGSGLAVSSLVAGPEMLVPAEALGTCAAVVDAGAALLYLADALSGNSSSWLKAGISAVGVIGDLTLNSSVAVKPALHGMNFYSKTTGQYVTKSLSTVVEASKSFFVSIGIWGIGNAVTK